MTSSSFSKVARRSYVSSSLKVCRNMSFPPELFSIYENKYGTKNYHIEYRIFLTNHLSHGMIALFKLNCATNCIKSFMDHYTSSNLETKSEFEKNYQLRKHKQISLAAEKCNWNDRNSYLGKEQNFYGIYDMMESDLESEFNGDLLQFVRTRFPLLSSGVSGGAFHGLIHLGYALSITHNKHLILEGMTYLTYVYIPFAENIPQLSSYNSQSNVNEDENKAKDGISDEQQKQMTLFSVLELVKKEGKLLECVKNNSSKFKKDGSFGTAMLCLSGFAKEMMAEYVHLFYDSIPLLTVPFTTKAEMDEELLQLKKYLMRACIELYVYGNGVNSENDFFLVHGVTSAWSLLQVFQFLLPNVLDINRAVVQFIHGVIALYVLQNQVDIIVDAEDHEHEFYVKNIMQIVDKVKEDVRNGRYIDEHVYKLIAVVLECLEDEMIDEKCAYYALRKIIKPLAFLTISFPNSSL